MQLVTLPWPQPLLYTEAPVMSPTKCPCLCIPGLNACLTTNVAGRLAEQTHPGELATKAGHTGNHSLAHLIRLMILTLNQKPRLFLLGQSVVKVCKVEYLLTSGYTSYHYDDSHAWEPPK